MQSASMTASSEGRGMATGSSMPVGAGMQPGAGSSFQYPGGGLATPAPSSHYQQTPSTATGTTGTTSTATPGYTTTEQSSRRTSGDWESSTTTAARGDDTSKTTQQTEHGRTAYGPWLPAFMCTLVLLVVLFLVPYIFLSSRGQATPQPFEQRHVRRTTPEKKAATKSTRIPDRHVTHHKPSKRPQPPAGHVGAQCGDSSDCKGEGNCVGGKCECDMPGTRVKAGVCVSASTTTTELPTTEAPETKSSDTPVPETMTSELPTTKPPETESSGSPVTEATISKLPTTKPFETEAPHSETVTTLDARNRTDSTMPPSIIFTYVHTVHLSTHSKNHTLVMTAGVPSKVKAGRNFTKPTKKRLKSNKQNLKNLESSPKAANSTGTPKRRAQRE